MRKQVEEEDQWGVWLRVEDPRRKYGGESGGGQFLVEEGKNDGCQENNSSSKEISRFSGNPKPTKHTSNKASSEWSGSYYVEKKDGKGKNTNTISLASHVNPM